MNCSLVRTYVRTELSTRTVVYVYCTSIKKKKTESEGLGVLRGTSSGVSRFLYVYSFRSKRSGLALFLNRL